MVYALTDRVFWYNYRSKGEIITLYVAVKLEPSRQLKKITIITWVIDVVAVVTSKLGTKIKTVGIDCSVKLLQNGSLQGAAEVIMKVKYT